ncbi:MAG: hypothetical protein AAF945_05715 [Actinomycetota bacterium]
MASLSPRLGALAIVAGLAVAACGSDSSDDAADGAPDAPAEASADAGSSDGGGDAASGILNFTAPLVGGGELDAQTLGDKPTAFWFWSPT